MDVQWTLVVEGLGRIERAEVRIHPFMLLVGENNSGKSYLASLLWGLVSPELDLFPEEVPTSASYIECQEWVREKIEHHLNGSAYTLTTDDYKLFFNWFNKVLDERKNFLAARIFNIPEMKIRRLELRDLRVHEPFELRFRTARPGVLIAEHDQGSVSIAALDPSKDSSDLIYNLICALTLRVVMGRLRIDSPTYLPASRTGFVLLYKPLVGQLIGSGLLESKRTEHQLHLTAPAISFLQHLTRMQPGEGRFQEEATLLEQGALQGRVALESGIGLNDFKYHPGGNAPPLSMALSSSLITELAPIILLLRHDRNPGLLILEEPEAHLHPKVQRLLARTLVRLVRKGLPVWVTTHSENFCQQINNLLKLSQHPNRTEVAKQLGYGEQDYLEPSEAVGFQFVTQGATSTVTELEKSASGFTMPTFNEELMALSRETLFLQREAAKPE